MKEGPRWNKKTQIRSWSRSSSVAALGGLVSPLFVFSVAALGPHEVRAEPPLPNPLLSFAFIHSYFLCLADFLQRR